MRGERTYDFPRARAQQIYEVMYSGRLFYIERKISLEGRVNLVFEDISQRDYDQGDCQYTLCRYSARYTAKGVEQYASNHRTGTITFNSGGSASFPASVTGQATQVPLQESLNVKSSRSSSNA